MPKIVDATEITPETDRAYYCLQTGKKDPENGYDGVQSEKQIYLQACNITDIKAAVRRCSSK